MKEYNPARWDGKLRLVVTTEQRKKIEATSGNWKSKEDEVSLGLVLGYLVDKIDELEALIGQLKK